LVSDDAVDLFDTWTDCVYVHMYIYNVTVFRGGAFNTELLPTEAAPLLLAGPDSSDVIDDTCQ